MEIRKPCKLNAGVDRLRNVHLLEDGALDFTDSKIDALDRGHLECALGA